MQQENNGAADGVAVSDHSATASNPSGGQSTRGSGSGGSKPKKPKKRSKDAAGTSGSTKDEGGAAADSAAVRKKPRKVPSRSSRPSANPSGGGGSSGGNAHNATSSGGNTNSNSQVHHHSEGLSAAQQAVQEQMRRALEEDQYSVVGSMLDVESDEDDNTLYNYRGIAVRLDKAALQQAIRKTNLLERLSGTALPASSSTTAVGDDEEDDDEEGRKDEIPSGGRRVGATATSKINKKRKNRKDEVSQLQDDAKHTPSSAPVMKDPLSLDAADDDMDRDGGSIFGATTGSNNSTWVECDKCKKWRRLRGVVDEKKLPKKWYCSMNSNDPDRARCSAPEEEYDSQPTPESAADARIRKHMRVWIRRLQCNEAYEARQPTLTRGKKRAVSSSSKDPYEWIRCCNPSCGKWRSVLRIMDAKTNVVDRTVDGEWYCVMNNWDEKTASCAAPQENLPAVGCPPWVMQDDH